MRSYKYILAFTSGMTALAAEFAASRLLQNIFGSSNIIWSIVIGLIMIYFSVGYWLGGTLADRDPTYKGLFKLLLIGSTALGVVPYISAPILRWAALGFDSLDLPIMAGAFVSTLVLFSIPITLLATTTPYLIKLEGTDAATLGREVGRINAVSTFGSVFGAFVPTLFLFGLIGTTRTIVVFAVLLMAIVLVGLLSSGITGKKVIALLLPIAIATYAIANDPSIKATPGRIFETESAYNYIEVVKQGEDTYLRLNEGQGYHSQYNPNNLFFGGPWEQFLLGPLFQEKVEFSKVNRIAIVGMAAGTTVRQAKAVYPNATMDGFEIDPKIVDVGKRYFGLDDDRVNIQIGDGRVLLDAADTRYDLVIVDAYRPPYIPPHLTTLEFFSICADSLTPNGMLAINVGRTPTDRRLINDLATTLNQVFPRVFIIDLPGTMNSIVFAGGDSASLVNYANNYETMVQKGDPVLLLQAATFSINHITTRYENGNIYTDDRSEIEWATNSLVLNYLLEGSEVQ